MLYLDKCRMESEDVHIPVYPGDARCGVRAQFRKVGLYPSYVEADKLSISPVFSCIKYPGYSALR